MIATSSTSMYIYIYILPRKRTEKIKKENGKDEKDSSHLLLYTHKSYEKYISKNC
jgi:hypothetical protein